MKRRRSVGSAGPPASARHEKLAGRPARTFSAVSAAMVTGLVMSSRFSSPRCTPVIPSDSALSVPRRLGWAAKISSRALARVNPPVTRATLSVGKYNKPFRAKKLPPWI